MRAVKSCEPSTYRSLCGPSNARPLRSSRAPFHSTRRRAQGSIQRRYGPAVEPNIPPPSRPKDESAANQDPESAPPEKKTDANSPPEQSQSQSQSSRDAAENASTEPSQPESEKAAQPAERKEPDEQQVEPEEEEEDNAEPEVLEAKQQTPPESKEPQSEERHNSPIFDGNPLDGVLHMPSPSAYLTPTSTPQQPPHMAPPPYVHHFDTYSLVQDLATGGFSDKQSVTIMKAVRTILQNNLDFAKQNLTSKSDVENETYLFKAACSELQSSLQTARNSEVQRQRASRTSLQHESDILSQRTNQELAGLKDDIKGMFNDHKMTVRELQRSIDTSVQELNYKITVSLNSDSKSEIEGLRWILTRRAALAIAISACKFFIFSISPAPSLCRRITNNSLVMILLFLRYSSTQRAQNTPEKKETPPKETKEAQKASEMSQHAQDAAPVAHLSESLG